MVAQSGKWMVLAATIWIQAFTGTNLDFSAYSSELKSVLGVSQVQLNYLATASDLGKALGWSAGLAVMWMPLWAVMFAAAAMGLVGYGVQWLVVAKVITLPYSVVFILCLLAGCSICWFNTVCFVLCIKNFPSAMPFALSLTVSFNGVSAALYNLAVKSIDSSSSAVYLLLNALIPLFISVVALIPILHQPPPLYSPDPDVVKRDKRTFLGLNVLAFFTGLYLLFLHPSDSSMARLLLYGAIFLLILPLGIPGIFYDGEWLNRTISSSFILAADDDEADNLQLHKQLLSRENEPAYSAAPNGISRENSSVEEGSSGETVMLGEEHKAGMLVRRLEFWLYYIAYICGGTLGLVYSNNLGQIAQSLGHGLMTSKLIAIYASFSFFGRLLSAAPDFIPMNKVSFSRTGWLAIALLPTPVAFSLLGAFGGNALAIQAGTALIGLSSGFIFAAAVSITSELFGPCGVSMNHNILITNIPIGSLVYGYLAATVYDSNATPGAAGLGEALVCMGRECYWLTFVGWGCVSVVGVVCSVMLFLRTRHAYHRFGTSRRPTICLSELVHTG
ncbi:protein NUCLEAR FUSION DEFECTIVE 4-like [Salvia hispanica]|uniref:protein NUCLEAR FUSION DEFECTIVE 4-like n=1 Tax=Salvia hispanica TaxID=49212 RepID=UPI002009BEFF|nr:protein NUCLEAR FUSION DEFECTIVE 4-like [Salvia hispanica]